MATIVRIATTTSVDNSDLANALTTAYEGSQSNYTLDWSSVGSGAAMNAARQGNADLVIAHDRVGEFVFQAEHFSLQRQWAFYNYFIMVGPKANNPSGAPTGTINGTNLQQCFTQIANNLNSGSPSIAYVSRGPSGLSGTYVREQQIWKRLSVVNLPNVSPLPNPTTPIPPPGIVIGGGGDGMMATLNATLALVQGGTEAYTMTDLGTWYQFLTDLDANANMAAVTLEVNASSDPYSLNQYVLMPVNPDICFETLDGTATINTAGAADFMNWLTSTTGQTLINGYTSYSGQLTKSFWGNAADAVEQSPGDGCLLRSILIVPTN